MLETEEDKQTDKNDFPNESLKQSENVSISKNSSNSEFKMTEKDKFPIIGVGASAGGLDAFKKLFENIPPDSGMAYIVIQHMDPHYKSNLAEILSNHTKMIVKQIDDGVHILPNHVYVIPPDYDLSIINSRLSLLMSDKSHKIHNTIDYFFKNLAMDQEENAICIVLSGFGNDGSEGLKAIKATGGLAIAQDPKTAEFDSMPRNAIKTGQVDFILSPEEMGNKIIDYTKSSKVLNKRIINPDETRSKELNKILVLIRKKTGYDFSFYKENTINRRIGRRMNINQISNISDYIRYLRSNSNEIEMLFKDVLINVTEFFRDPEAYKILKEKYLPDLINAKPPGEIIRIWVPGCSTGEEVYSIAMIVKETIEELGKDNEIQIFGTDLDSDAIKTARNGTYPLTIAKDVSSNRLNKFFIRKDDSYIIKKNIRELVIFAVHDAIRDPPFAYLDLISCRNLLIYLKEEAQDKLLSQFEYSLQKDGILFLGTSESIGNFIKIFTPLDKKWKIFRSTKTASNGSKLKLRNNYFTVPTEFEKRFEYDNTIKRRNITQTAKDHFLTIFVPPSVMIDESGEILYIHGKVGKYLELASGRTTINIFDMARNGLKFELNTAIKKSIKLERNVKIDNLAVEDDGNINFVNVDIKPFKEKNETLLIVSFENVERSYKEKELQLKPTLERDKHILELEIELSSTKEELNEKLEEMNTSYEELKAANEELQSLNEESQSTNEELETAKEELQSVNEEMVTVNSELQMTIEDLTHSNDDLQNLINSTQIPTLFLDNELNVRKFTKETKKLINLIESDVGRPVKHIVSNLRYDKFEEDLEDVLHTLMPKQLEIETENGNWYLIRIMPYKTVENVIDGLVVTFNDISIQKNSEKLVQDALNYSNSIINTIREPLIVLNPNLLVVSANKSFYTVFNLKADDVEGKKFYDLSEGKWGIKKLRELLENILPENNFFEDFEVEDNFPNIGLKKMFINARKVYREDIKGDLILLSMEMINKSLKTRNKESDV